MKSGKLLHSFDRHGVRWGLATVWMVLGLLVPPQVAAAELPAPQHVGKQLRCPVCGMYPSRYPQWRVQLIHADGGMRAFDSPADLLRYLENRGRYEKDRTGALPRVAAIYVTDFSQGGWVEIRQAWVVRDSRLRGPMNGPDYPAFATEAAAQDFAGVQGGQVHRFSALISLEFQDDASLKAMGAHKEPQTNAATRQELPPMHSGHDGHHHH